MYRKILSCVLILILMNSITVFGDSTETTIPKINIGTSTLAPIFNNTDGDVGIIKEGNDLWVMFADGGTNWKRFKGTSFDDLVEQSDGKKDSSFIAPSGDDNHWLTGLWSDETTGKWYAIVHTEFNYGHPWPEARWFRQLGLATSTDQGANWHYEGEIIKSDNPVRKENFTTDYFDWGVGDPKLFVDQQNGYIYVWYMHSWVDKITGYRYQSMRVARSPIEAKMAPGSWTKFYNNTWNEPGIGGRDSDIFVNADSSTVFYSTVRQEYIAIGKKSNGQTFISTCTDLALQNWSEPKQFTDDSNMYWYNWIVDTDTWERTNIGENIRIYSSQNYYENVPSKYTNAVITDQNITSNNSFTAFYPPQSLNDGNPNWDWSIGLEQPSSYTNDFSKVSELVRSKGSGTLSTSNGFLQQKSSDDKHFVAYDAYSPSYQNGNVSFDLKPISNGRTGIVFRYQAQNKFAFIGYDINGTWVWENGSGGWGSLTTTGPVLQNNQSYHIEVQYLNSHIILSVNGQEIFNDDIPDIYNQPGKIGFKNWYYSESQYDNINFTKL